MLSFRFAWDNADPVNAFATAIANYSSFAVWGMFFMFSLSPIFLAVAVGQSILLGRPLRFFLIGFSFMAFS